MPVITFHFKWRITSEILQCSCPAFAENRPSQESSYILKSIADCSPLLSLVQCARFVRECTHGSRHPTTKNLKFSNQVIWGPRDVPNYPLTEHLRRTQTFNARPSALMLLYLNGVESRGGKWQVWSLSTLTGLVLPVSKTSDSRWSPCIDRNR